MTDIVVRLPVREAQGSAESLAHIVIIIGAIVSTGLLMVLGLQYFGIADTSIGTLLMDFAVNGERNFDPTRDHHEQWGDALYALLAVPILVSFIIALPLAAARKR